ncbi:MAG TPA: nucleotide exchange factor GrpE [Marmoricola sp.]|nr:nucleotide exchange factor GrpE [Marmoricola sp.]
MTSGADEHGSPEAPVGDRQAHGEGPPQASEPAAAPQPGSFADAAPEVADGSSLDEAGQQDAEEASMEADLADARKALAELTADLQRLQAEYLNYKRRVDRDRELVRQNATFAVVTPLLEVLDTIDRAREHEELDGGFKAVAEQLERAVAGMGLVRFGAPGDEFDPMLHEALSHAGSSPEVSTMTCQHVVKAGYKIGERVVRAAQVIVVDPEETPAAAQEPEHQDGADVRAQE